MCRTDVILKKISDLQFVQSMEPMDMEHQLCSANSSPGFVVGFLLSPSRYSQAAFFPQPLTSSPCLLCFKVQPSLHWQHHLPGSSQMTCLQPFSELHLFFLPIKVQTGVSQVSCGEMLQQELVEIEGLHIQRQRCDL